MNEQRIKLLGDQAIDPRKVDLSTCGMVVEKMAKLLALELLL